MKLRSIGYILSMADELTNIKDLQTSDGWMRATSPNGNPNFENIVNWSGSLGVGKKDPEKGQTLEEE